MSALKLSKTNAVRLLELEKSAAREIGPASDPSVHHPGLCLLAAFMFDRIMQKRPYLSPKTFQPISWEKEFEGLLREYSDLNQDNFASRLHSRLLVHGFDQVCVPHILGETIFSFGTQVVVNMNVRHDYLACIELESSTLTNYARLVGAFANALLLMNCGAHSDVTDRAIAYYAERFKKLAIAMEGDNSSPERTGEAASTIQKPTDFEQLCLRQLAWIYTRRLPMSPECSTGRIFGLFARIFVEAYGFLGNHGGDRRNSALNLVADFECSSTIDCHDRTYLESRVDQDRGVIHAVFVAVDSVVSQFSLGQIEWVGSGTGQRNDICSFFRSCGNFS